MSTSGSFTPPGTPPCDETIFTAAALRALRDAGSLRVGCHYRVQGPQIGTGANTSATVIELHAVAANELGTEAKVNTTFDNTAWAGLYDIDLDTNGTIQRLTDNWNNTAQDADLGAPTVQQHVPWHRGSNTFRDNFFDDVTLPGWDSAAGEFRDNTLQEVTVDLSNVTGGTSFFRRNHIVGGSFTANVPTAFIQGNQITDATVSHLGTGAGSFSFQNNTMLTGTLTVDAATTSQVTVNNNVFGGTVGGYIVSVAGKTAGTAIISGNRLFNRSVAAQDMLVSGSGNYNVTSNEIGAGVLTLAGSGDASVTGNSLSATSLNHQGSGVLDVNTSTVGGSVITTAAGSTRGLTVSGALLNGSNLTQNGTGSTNTDTFFASTGTTLQDATVNLNATAAVTPASVFNGLVAIGSTVVTVNDHTDTTPIRYSRVDSDSNLTIDTGGIFDRSQARSGATVTVSHPVTSSVVEGAFTKATTGANTNRLVNKSYDDWV